MLSLIVPVYNVRAYLDEFLASLSANRWSDDVELLMVDDCSDDGSFERVSQWLQHFGGRGRLLRTEKNSGVGAARTLGLEKSTGKFVWFADSDDILAKHAIQDTLRVLESSTDLSMLYYSSHTRLREHKSWLEINEYPKGTITREEYASALLSGRITTVLWDKVIRSELLGGKVSSRKSREDAELLARIAHRIITVRVIPRANYVYRLRSGSITARDSYYQDLVLAQLQKVEERKLLVEAAGHEIGDDLEKLAIARAAVLDSTSVLLALLRGSREVSRQEVAKRIWTARDWLDGMGNIWNVIGYVPTQRILAAWSLRRTPRLVIALVALRNRVQKSSWR